MLYTGKGDGGTTKLFNTPQGERVSKTHPVFEALGTVDELVACIGLLKVATTKTNLSLGDQSIAHVLHEVQETLFVLQAELAGAGMSIGNDRAPLIAAFVDLIEKELPPIKTFFIAGGTETAALADVCRAVSRRMERTLLRAREADVLLSASSLTYANRLSSLLYAVARYANHVSGIAETSPSYGNV